ncbi:S-adenosyl methyltransferase [Sinosporangium album]|uniref:S-adenosyl methyltransferase n=1 Tax=Sinosporangium album TaxID=504805 RepID=A0A1G8IP65_9ACTN|nr:SAM-dependent methyltransferase [Sinosporangium album]SDI20300.1 S-adenosyl methyltransferase [Sinosporangium album]
MSTARVASQDTPDEGRYDFSTPSIARVYNAATGGKDNLLPDRNVLDKLQETAPKLPEAAMANLEFVTRATEVVAAAGIHQWLNLGCGLPPEGYETTHATVVRHHEGARVVYVDNDKHVTVHGRVFLDVPGATGVIEEDAWNVDEVLGHQEAGLLDPSQPIGIIATALAHFKPAAEDPGGILRRYMAHFTFGYLIFSHARSDLLSPEELKRMIADYKRTADIYPRPRDVIQKMFLNGLELLEPGLVEASTWRPHIAVSRDVGRAHFVAAVARFGHAEAPARGAA